MADVSAPDVVIALTASGVTVVLDVSGGALPTVAHWGPTLDRLDAESAAALVAAGVPAPGRNEVDVPARVSLLPEAWTGWTGRPGLTGSRSGRHWSTRFTVTSVRVDAAAVTDTFVAAGPASVEIEASDTEARLRLLITVELLPGGALRSRAALTNDGDDEFTVDGLALAYPVPAECSQLLDFAGRWGRERVPQRMPFGVGVHARENRKGRTGADSAYVLHAGTPGFGFADGAVHAVHVGFSGNHLHYAERTFTGTRLLGGGELLLPGEVRLGTGETYESPWLYGSFGVGLDAVARRFHAVLRGGRGPGSLPRQGARNMWCGRALARCHRSAR
jgi:alpha-galactosidase